MTSPDLVAALRAAGLRDVDDSSRRRAEYSTDASNYRVPPAVVVMPRHVEEVLAVLEVARATGTPLTARGAGTSIAGNSIGPGIVLDTSRHLGAVLEVDPDARTARVQPGTVMATLQRAAAPHGLRFGPDPSTWTRATLGGMIGNNACGPHAVAYGKTAQNVRSLDWVDGLGRRFTAGSGDASFSSVPGLADLVRARMAVLRTELGRFGRQVSGYSLEHLLPEHGSHLARALVGTEGTVGLLLEAELDLVPVATAPTLVVLGYPDMPSAADAVPTLLAHRPLAIEGMDARLVDLVRQHRGPAFVPELPPGGGWLMVEVSADADADGEGAGHLADPLARARALAADSGTSAVRVLPAGPEASALWRIREDGAGLGGRTPSGEQGWPGWEDSAVPPERLGAYLRDLEALMAGHGVDGLVYGHFGDGCIHVRIDLPLADAPERMRPFVEDAARLVASHGGSFSGEHGDGRARSELLPIMYSAEAIEAFAAFKHLLDPDGVLNPGVLVAPRPLDADLRRPAALPLRAVGGFSFAHDGADVTSTLHRCTGVGKCRADLSASGGFMCPSYLATKDEKDSTRGRARVLQEMANGSVVRGGWASPEVHEALDLCLSCKACASDCPTGIDMATYKSEALYRTYRGKVRPLRHYLLGQLPRWARLAGVAPALANAPLSVPFLRRPVLRLGGMDPRRSVPRFAREPFRRWRRRHVPTGDGTRGEVLLWVDSFADAFDPDVAVAAVRLLESAGYTVRLPAGQACCGLTWISTGQLDGARKRLRGLLDVLEPEVEAGLPVVGLEPSCTAALRTDLPELLPDDPRASAVAGAVRTLAEQLEHARADGWEPPALQGVSVLAQPHCHQHATVGYASDTALLRAAGAEVDTVAGCCGLAGNFGMEAGHYEVSVAVAENGVLPALRAAAPGTVLLADGFSCRTQVADLADAPSTTLAQLLASRLP